jgi:Flp pilus assembly protein TadB
MTSSIEDVTSERMETGGSYSTTPTMEEQFGVQDKPERMWNLSTSNMILILCFLCAAILILILAVVALACCLCITRRRYNVERQANIYQSNSTIDRISTVEVQRGMGNHNKGAATHDRASVEY